MHLAGCPHKLVRRQALQQISRGSGFSRAANFLVTLASREYDDPGVVEDGAGKLWLATWGGGIHRLDPIQDSVFKLFFSIARGARAGVENRVTELGNNRERAIGGLP